MSLICTGPIHTSKDALLYKAACAKLVLISNIAQKFCNQQTNSFGASRLINLNFFKNSFEGKERLWKVFWLLGFGGKLILFFFTLALFYLLTDFIGNYTVTIGIVSVFLFKLYWGYSVWKCSDNVDTPFLKYMALIYTALSVFFGLAGLTSHDYRVLKDPRPLFHKQRDLKTFI